MKNVYIYYLKSPITNEIRYIGKTTNLNKRLNKHINQAKKDTKRHVRAWIKSILIEKEVPIIEVLDVVSNNQWQFWEQYWIDQFRQWGFRLTNMTEGGEGVDTGTEPWNKGTVGIMKRNKTTFKKGNIIGKETRFKKGDKPIYTPFTQGHTPWNKKIVLQKTISGVIINKYDSIKEASKKTGFSREMIRRKCNTDKLYKGYLWEREV